MIMGIFLAFFSHDFSLHFFHGGVYFQTAPPVRPSEAALVASCCCSGLLQHILEERLELRSSLPDFKGDRSTACHWDPTGDLGEPGDLALICI